MVRKKKRRASSRHLVIRLQMRARTGATYLSFDRPRRAPRRRPPRPRTPLVRDFAATAAAARPARGTFSISSHFRGLSVARRRCCRHHRVRQIEYLFVMLLSERVREPNVECVIYYSILPIRRNNCVTRSATRMILYVVSDTMTLLLLLLNDHADLLFARSHVHTITWRSFRERFDSAHHARRRANHD